MAPALNTLKPARPIARWQVMVLGAVLGVVGLIALPADLDRSITSVLTYGYLLLLLLLFFVPQRLYGTTVELLEGKLLRIVESLEEILFSGDLEFTEAAFFRVKDNLRDARQELRQQIDLAHRRWR